MWKSLETNVPGFGDFCDEELKIQFFCLFPCQIENMSINFFTLLLLKCVAYVTST